MICWLSIESDRQAVALGEEVRERVEVADDGVGRELRHLVEVGADVGGQHARRREHVAREGAVAVHAVVDVPDGQALDLDDVGEALRQEGVGAPADDDLHLVARGDQVLADDLAPRRVPHALADDAVEDAHGAQGRGSAGGTPVRTPGYPLLRAPVPAPPGARTPSSTCPWSLLQAPVPVPPGARTRSSRRPYPFLQAPVPVPPGARTRSSRRPYPFLQAPVRSPSALVPAPPGARTHSSRRPYPLLQVWRGYALLQPRGALLQAWVPAPPDPRAGLPADADRPGELRDALHDVGDALEEVDARRPLLDDVDRDLLDRDPAAVGADDELAREDVLVDEARAHGVEQRASAGRP